MYKLLLSWRYLRSRYIALASIISVTLGVATLIIVNAVFSPMLAIDAPFTEMMASKIYLWRLSLAALTVFLWTSCAWASALC